MNPIDDPTPRPAVCDLCGLPLARAPRKGRSPRYAEHFCCYGCYLTYSVTGSQGEEGLPVLFLARLGLAAFLAMNVMTWTWALYGEKIPFLFPVEPSSRGSIGLLILFLALPVYLLVGIPFLKNAWREFRRLRPGVDSLIALGTTAAFVVSVHAVLTGGTAFYFDTATMVLVLVTFGRYLEAQARVRTGQVLRALYSGTVAPARRVTAGGDDEACQPADLRLGDLLRVLPGETIAADGTIEAGETSVNESLLTGESLPRRRTAGEEVYGGSVNCDGHILVRATRTGEDSLLGRLTQLVDRVRSERTPLQLTADQITRFFIPAVILIALISGTAWGFRDGYAQGILNGLSVLLIACPCALGIGATLAGALGYTVAAKRGILLGSISALETAGSVTEVFFDKTGTLTEGTLQAAEFAPVPGTGVVEDEIVAMSVALEAHSEHPMGKAIARMNCAVDPRVFDVMSSQVLIGEGIQGSVRDSRGTAHWVSITRSDASKASEISRAVSIVKTESYVFIDTIHVGTFSVTDSLRREAQPSILRLTEMGIRSRVVSGDSGAAVDSAMAALGGIIEGKGCVLPEGKVRMIRDAQFRGEKVAMVGDGINDAASIAAADVGITLRSGSDLSRLAGSVTLMDDDLLQLPWLFAFGRKVRRTIQWNFFWAYLYNGIGIVLAVRGNLEPVWAAAAMVASSILVITNSTRVARGHLLQRTKISGSGE
jgi:P-type Cu+ transporter